MSAIRLSVSAAVGLAALLLPATLQSQEAFKVADVEKAVLPLPVAERSGATVLVVKDNEAQVVRQGNGEFVCIADDPSDDRFQAVCYHDSLEPYMARGRALRREGVTGTATIEKRWEEIEAGALAMPEWAMLHQVFGAAGWDGTLENAQRLTVIYIPFATTEELGLPAGGGAGPWVMFPGSPTAHIMISG